MKNISGKTLIFYTFQDSPASKEQQYNVTTFKKSAPTQVKIRDVLFQLPLDYQNNSYHFRFKSEFFEGEDKVIGWIDISNLLAKVPMINNSIFIKILKIKDHQYNKLFSKDKLKAVGLIDPKTDIKAQNVPKANHTPKKQNRQANLIDDMGFNSLEKGSTKKEVKNGETGSKSKQIFQFSPQKTFTPETPQQRLEAFQQMAKKQQQERQNEKVAAKELEEKINEWGYSGHKTINNLTTLLATLHTIWPQWKPVSLSDMLNSSDVQNLFKKAVIKVHPDKNRKKDFRTRYLAKRVFELLNDAKVAQQNSS